VGLLYDLYMKRITVQATKCRQQGEDGAENTSGLPGRSPFTKSAQKRGRCESLCLFTIHKSESVHFNIVCGMHQEMGSVTRRDLSFLFPPFQVRSPHFAFCK
jgi:hypothetical protein